MIATALEHNGAARVYIIGRREEVLEKAAKAHSARTIPLSPYQSPNPGMRHGILETRQCRYALDACFNTPDL